MVELLDKYNFCYITICLINWKMYVGDHSTDNLNDGYLGSGICLTNAIKKHNKSNFIRIDLEFFKTKQEAFNAQEKYIKIFKTIRPKGYNISPMGGVQCKGGMSEKGRKRLSDKAKKRIGSKNSFYGKRHTEETKKLISQNLDIRGEKNPFYSKHHTEETKIKIGKKNRQKCRTEEVKNRISNSQIERYKKIKENNACFYTKSKCPHCGLEGRTTNIKRYHFDNCKHKKINI